MARAFLIKVQADVSVIHTHTTPTAVQPSVLVSGSDMLDSDAISLRVRAFLKTHPSVSHSLAEPTAARMSAGI